MNFHFHSKEETEFTMIFKSQMNNVYGFACRMLNNRQMAEDITQESFLRLYKLLLDGHKIDKPHAWLIVTARNLCLNLIRDTHNEVQLESLNPYSIQNENTDPDVKRLLNNAIAQLDLRQREALILKEYEGFSYCEIANIMGTTIPGVRSILYRARLELKNLIERTNKGR